MLSFFGTRLPHLGWSLSALLVACGGGQVEPPDDDDGGPSTQDPASSSGDTTSDNPTGDATSDATSDATDDTGDPGTGDTGGTDACLGPDGCFSCPPNDPDELLNACSDATCEPFANKDRLPLLNADGTLPPLP